MLRTDFYQTGFHFILFSVNNKLFILNILFLQISPTVGPQKSMKVLEVFGSGFWDSKDILVKFSRTGFPGIPSRSSMGRFLGDHIACKPPRLADAGSYDISVSMDGKLFVSNSLCVLITFADPTIVEVSPAIVNIRQSGGVINLSLSGSHLDSMPELQDSIVVLLRNIAYSEDSRGSITKGALIPLPEDPTQLLDPHNISAASIPSVPSEASTSAHSIPHNQHAYHHHYRTVTTDAFTDSVVSQNGDADFLSVQISLNGADYSIPCDTHIFAHSFYASSVYPNVVCLDSQNPVALVAGHGMFNPEVLDYVAVLSFYDVSDSQSCLAEIVVPVEWQNLSNLAIYIPPMSTVFVSDEESDDPVEITVPPVLSCSLSLKVTL
jgi:hypothetical protein